MAHKVKLTKQTISSIPIPEKGNKVTYDTDVTGFGIRVTAKGVRSFILNYRINNRERRITIGAYPTWTATAAREEARLLRRDIDQGIDPLAERIDKRDAPTIKDLWERYKEEHLPTKTERSASDDESMWHNYILNKLGGEKLEHITFSDISRLHSDISKDKPVRANHVVQILRKAFNLAIRWNWVSKNPCEGIQMNTVEARERFASRKELEAIFDVMAYHQEQTSCDAIRLIILTGARKGETLKAQWSEIDFEAGIWTKPSSHTKQKKLHRVPLSSGAIEFLRERHNDKTGPWIFPSPFTDGHLTDFKRTWDAIRKQASVLIWKNNAEIKEFISKLENQTGKPATFEVIKKEADKKGLEIGVGVTDLRVHDLRHTYASILASQGHSLALIGALLGHTQAQTTKRYAHLLDDPLREATNGVESFIKAG
jgi:integrase